VSAIEVLPDSMHAASATIAGVAQQLQSAQGSFASTANAAAGCDPIAAGPYEHMHAAWAKELAFLQAACAGMAHKLAGASDAYVSTDSHQMQAHITTGTPGH